MEVQGDKGGSQIRHAFERDWAVSERSGAALCIGMGKSSWGQPGAFLVKSSSLPHLGLST